MSRRTIFLIVALSIGSPIVVGGGLLLAALYYGHGATEDQCLANLIDKDWSRTGHKEETWSWRGQRLKTDAEKKIARQQAEAIARIKIKLAKERSESLCPSDWTRWGTHTLWRQVVGASGESERWRIVYPIAQKARQGVYEFPWPKEFECAIDYAATKARVVKRAKGELLLHHVGDIGTMSLYGPAEKCRL